MKISEHQLVRAILRSPAGKRARDNIVTLLYPALRLKQNFILSALRNFVNSEDILLDVGCGERSAEALVIDRNARYIGVEYPVWQGLYSIVTIKERPDAWLDIMAAGVSLASLDVIVMFDVLEHISNPDLALKSCHSLLRDGGHVIILIPFLMEIHGGSEGEQDFLRVCPSGLYSFLERAGFSTIQTQKLGGFGDSCSTLVSGFFLRHYLASSGLRRAFYFGAGAVTISAMALVRPFLNSNDRLQRNPPYIAAVASK